MSREYQNDELNKFVLQRHAAIEGLIRSLQNKIGRRVQDNELSSTLISIVSEMGNFYRIAELQFNIMFAMQKNIEVVALEAFETEGDKAAINHILYRLRKELAKAIKNTTARWRINNGT